MGILLDHAYNEKVPGYGVRDAYGDVLLELGAKDPNMVVLSADLAGSTKTAPFKKIDPRRMMNMGVAEQDMIGVASGLALSGKTVFVSTFAIFIACRSLEQVRQSIAHVQLPVKIVSTHGGISVGPDGATHQMIEDISNMRTIPLMNVIVPGDAEECRQVIRFIHTFDKPVYVRTSRVKFPMLLSPEYRFEFGKGAVLRESPADEATIVACGLMLHPALLAAKQLADEGIAVRVVNMATIKPIDSGLLARCSRETGAFVTVEEHSILGGLGSAVCEALAETAPAPVIRMGMNDRFGLSGDSEELLEYFGFTPSNIAAQVKKVISRKHAPTPVHS